jgi:hypothetical protein
MPGLKKEIDGSGLEIDFRNIPNSGDIKRNVVNSKDSKKFFPIHFS